MRQLSLSLYPAEIEDTTLTILIDTGEPDWMSNEELRDFLQPLLPDVEIRCAPESGDLADITVYACTRLSPDVAAAMPNLQLVQKLGAGVDAILNVPTLAPEVRVARLKPDAPADEIAEYCLAYVLREQRNMIFHQHKQAAEQWDKLAPRRASDTTVAVLGLGHIGARTADVFASLGFRVLGWSRSPKSIVGVEALWGAEALADILAQSDYVAAILPSTPHTRGLFNAERLAGMKPGAMLINAGRGDLIIEQDLLAALDAGKSIRHAVLDVVPIEPLPPGHPFWAHPAITITPHVSGWHLDGGLEVVAENYRRLRDAEPLLHEVDRQAGY